jgi:Holliday junction resolvasome RuvABC endonuclease subunit
VSVRLLGIDTGFTATGLALVEWDGMAARLARWTTITTATTPKKRRLLVVDDHLRRIREIRSGISAFLGPRGGVDVASMEAFSQARNAAAAARQAFGYAVAVVELGILPIAQFTPQEIHKRLGVPKRPPLPKSAPKGCSKEQERAADKARRDAAAANKTAVWAHVVGSGLCAGPWGELTEHESDAACAALACLVPSPIDLVLAVQAGRSP